MNTKALVAVIAFVAAASAMAQFDSKDTQVASASLAGASLSMTEATPSLLAFESAGRSTDRPGDAATTRSTQAQAVAAAESERLSFPEPGNFAMALAGLAVIGFVVGRRQGG